MTTQAEESTNQTSGMSADDPVLESLIAKFKQKMSDPVDVLIFFKKTGLTAIVIHDDAGSILLSTSLPEPNIMCVKAVLDAFLAGAACYYEDDGS